MKMVIALLFLAFFAFFADSVEAQQKQNINDESNIPQARSGQMTLYQTTTTTNTPSLMSYLGILADAAGKPIFTSTSVTFSIYASATGGSPLWFETHNLIPALTGVFGVALGSANPISPALFKENSTLYIAVKVANDVEMSPRQRITSAAFAFSADTATPREGYGNPVGIGLANAPGTAITLARSDHLHQGVRSLAKSGSSPLYGDVTLSAGINAVLSQTGQNLEFWVPSTAFARVGVSPNAPTLTGDVALAEGTNITLSQTGQTIKITGRDAEGGAVFTKIHFNPTVDNIPITVNTVPIKVTGIADSTATLIDLDVKAASAVGGIIAVDYAAATTLTGSVEGVHLDLGANVSGNRNVTGVNVTLPSDNVLATRIGYKVTSTATANGLEIGVDIAGSSDIGVQITGATTDITTTGGEALIIESDTTGPITIGGDSSAESLNLGTGAGAKTLLIGSTNTSSSTSIQSGSGNIALSPGGTGDVVVSLDDNTNTIFNGTIASDVSINLVEVNITGTAVADTGNLVGLAVKNLNETGTTGTPDSLIAAISLDANETVSNGLLIEQNATGGSIDNGILISAPFGIINDGLQIGLSGQIIPTAIRIDSTGVTTDIILQNGEKVDNNTDDLVTFTGIGGINNESFTIDLDSVASSGATLSSGGAFVLINDNLSVGIDGNTTEDIDEAGFAFSGNDLYVADMLGVNGNAFIDGALDVDGAVNILAGVLTDSSVTTADLADSSVTTAKIADLNVTTAKIADLNVTTAKIADGGVTTAKIAAANVTEAKIADGGVTETKLATGSVTNAKLAVGSVTEDKLAAGSVTETKLGAGSVTNTKIVSGSVTTGIIADGNVTEIKLATGSVTNAKLGAGSVTTDKLLDGSVTEAKLAAGSVTTDKLGSNISITNVSEMAIGVASATKGLLEVQGSKFFNRTSAFRFLNINGEGSGDAGTLAISIHASDRIAGGEFNAFSDARIKNIQGVSDGAADLNTLRQIEIVDFTYKDPRKDSGLKKKVIGQQLAKVYPQAVSFMTDVVADIMRQATVSGGVITLANHGLNAGDRVKLIFEEGDVEKVYKVLSVTQDTFTVDVNKQGGVFVYGREVDDFHIVDYEAIAMLNVSATQELAVRLDRLEEQQKIIAAQQKLIESLQAEIKAIRERLASEPDQSLPPLWGLIITHKSGNPLQ